MAGISVSIGADYAALAKIQSKFAHAAAKIRDGFAERIGHRAFDYLLHAGRSLPGIIKEAIDAGGKLSDQMAKTGAAGEGLVILGKALENAGMSADRAGQLLSIMQRSIAGLNEENQQTAGAFARLGMSMADLRSKDPVEAMREIGKSIAGIEDPAERTALAMRIFGRAGADALVLFSDRNAFANAERTLGSLPKVLAENADRFDKLSDQMAGIRTYALQIGASMATQLLPAFESMSAKLQGMDLTSFGKSLGNVASATLRLTPAVKVLAITYATLKLKTLAAGFIALAAGKTAAAGATGILAAAMARLNAVLLANPYGLVIAGLAGLGLAITDVFKKAEAAMTRTQTAAEKMSEITSAVSIAELLPEITDADSLAAALEKIADAQKILGEEFDRAAAGMNKNSAAYRALASGYEESLRVLSQQEIRIRKVTRAEMEANAARIAATKAEQEYQAALAASNEALESSAKALEKAMEARDKARFDALSDQEKMVKLTEQEAAARAKAAAVFATGTDLSDPATLAKDIEARRAAGYESKDDAARLEALAALVTIQTESAKLEKGIAEEARKAEEAYRAALADSEQRIALAEAAANAEWEKVRAMEAAAALAARIAELESAGMDSIEAETRARREAAAADSAAAAEISRSAADRLAEAESIAAGKETEYALAKRIAELERDGMSRDDAERTAQAEKSLESLRSIAAAAQSGQFQSSVGPVSDMQRIGGGGGAIASGLDYSRQQTRLQQQMVEELRALRANQPRPSIAD